MPQPGLDDLDVEPVTDEQARVVVAKIVEAELARDGRVGHLRGRNRPTDRPRGGRPARGVRGQSKKNRAAFENALSPYIDAARKASTAPRRTTKKSTPRATPEDREWLRSNGFPNVKDRGRLAGEAIEALKNR